MCTVSYLPLAGGGYILTSNRDEAPDRNAVDLAKQELGNGYLLYPVDPGAGGSWFCVSSEDKTACLLNGAYEPFLPDAKYTHSRGIVLLDLIKHASVSHFAETYDFSNTAPFTAVLVSSEKLHELIWDGSSVMLRELTADKPAFWSSVTLYPEDVRIWRKGLFETWLQAHPDFSQDDIINFHRYGSTDDHWNGFVMNREDRVKTLSISSVKREADEMQFIHDDLYVGNHYSRLIDLISAHVEEN